MKKITKENEEIVVEILKGFNNIEKEIIKNNEKLFIEVYRKGMQNYFNFINKNWPRTDPVKYI